jgi:hypothetical protein
MGIPEPHWDTRSPLGLDLGLYFLSPLGIGMSLEKPKLYEFRFGESKTRPRPPPPRCHAYIERVCVELFGCLFWCLICSPISEVVLENKFSCEVHSLEQSHSIQR